MKQKKCLICHEKLTGKKLSNHIKKIHNLSSKDYTIKYLYNNKEPVCLNCGGEVRYSAYIFKKYCSGCSLIASKNGGKKGGKAKAWNKGKTKKDDERIKKQAESMMGDLNHFYRKSHTKETRNKISKTKLLSRVKLATRVKERESEFTLVTDLNSYISRQRQYLEFECKSCGHINKKTLQAFERGSLCEKCYPLSRSRFEIEICNFLEAEGVNFKASDRTVLNGKEIDILVSDYRIGIEANGLFWHSELNADKDRYYHLMKTENMLKNKYKLIHIFEDDWRDKQEICKSLILHKLGLTKRKVYARKCIVKELSKKEEIDFFNKTHINGFAKSRKCLGLYFKDELIAAMSVRIPYQKKYKDTIEIARFSTALNTAVIGGLSKLLKKISAYAKKEKFLKVLSYADRLFGEGDGYKTCGFSYEGNTGLSYWYTDGRVRISRFSVMSVDGKSQKEVARERKLYKVWGCGSNIYMMNISQQQYT